jgi:hypothetical protein
MYFFSRNYMFRSHWIIVTEYISVIICIYNGIEWGQNIVSYVKNVKISHLL